MGNGASSNVKKITINQSDHKWDQYKGRRGSASSKRSASSLTKKIRQSANSTTSQRRREEELKSALAAADKKILDAEEIIRNLRRELCTLELRNSELVGENSWLKQQIGPLEVPLSERMPEAARIAAVEVENGLREELQKCKKELSNVEKANEEKLITLRKELTEVIDQMREELGREKETTDKLRDVIEEQAMAKRQIRDALSGATSPTLSEANTTLHHSNCHRQQSEEYQQGSVADNYEVEATSSFLDEGEKECLDSVEDYNDSARPSIRNRSEYSNKAASDVFSASICTHQGSSSGRRVLPPLQPRAKENICLRNVYTFSEFMEPVKVIETPRTPELRPATTDTKRSSVQSRDSSRESGGAGAPPTMLRGSSAPMLFTSRPQRGRIGQVEDLPQKNNSELQAVNDSSRLKELDEGNIKEQSVKEQSDNDDDVEDLLGVSVPNLSKV